MARHTATIVHIEGGRWPFAWEDLGLEPDGRYATLFVCNGAEFISRTPARSVKARERADRDALMCRGWLLDSVDFREAR
jgi:hypothetical protein